MIGIEIEGLDENIESNDLYAVISKRTNGIVGFTLTDGEELPLICCSFEMVEGLAKVAKEISKLSGEILEIYKFTNRELIEVIE